MNAESAVDTRSDDELRAAIDAGKNAERELSFRHAARAQRIDGRILRLLADDPTAIPFDPSELCFAAHARCSCGAGMAYAKGCSLHGAWHCSAILRGLAARGSSHTAELPFALYEVKSEGQPSANGATTRDAGEPSNG